MEYTVTINDDATASLNLTYSPADIEEAFQKAYQKAAQKVKLNGFRQGKAPLEMVKKALGESVADDAVTILLSDSINDLYSKLEFKAYKPPKIEIEKFERHTELKAKAIYETAPDVTLGNYKGLSVEVFNLNVTDEDITGQLKDIQLRLAKTQEREAGEKAEETDLIDLDLEIKNDAGEIVQDNKSTQYYMGLNPKQKKLDNQFLGLSVGDTKSFDFTYEEDDGVPELVGKTFQYNIKVNTIFKVFYPELDDALAQEWDESPTLEDLKSKLKNDLRKQAEDRLNSSYTTRILSQILAHSDYNIPQSLIEDEAHEIFHQFTHDYNLGHITIEKYAEMLGTDLEKVKENFNKRAKEQIKYYLTVHKLAAVENITITQPEIDEIYTRLDIADKEKSAVRTRVQRNIYENLLAQKVYDFLLANSDKQGNKEISLTEALDILNKKPGDI